MNLSHIIMMIIFQEEKRCYESSAIFELWRMGQSMKESGTH